MANQFYVSPLGGANPLQGLGMIAQGLDRRKEEEEKQAQQMRMQELGAEAMRLYGEGTPDEIAKFSIQNPEMGQLLSQQIGFKNEATQENMRKGMESILAGGDPEQILTERIQMVEAQGGDATQTRNELAQYQANPEGYMEKIERSYAFAFPQQYNAYAKTKTKGADFQYKDGLVFNPATGDVKRTEYYQDPSVTASSTTTETSTANSKDWATYQELKKTDPEGAKQFGRKVGFVSSDGTQLSSHLQKRLSTATDSAIEAENAAASLSGLAKEFDQANVGGGLFQGKWREAIKDATGSQDAVTELRRRYTAIRGSQVVNNLPPGAASDKDIDMALAGFPSDNATGEQISSFLTGLAKLERERAKFENFKANYISDNSSEKGMLKSWKESQAKPAPAEMSDDDLRKELGL